MGARILWQFYSVEFNEKMYMRSDFKIGIDAGGINTGQDLWVDDLTVVTHTQTKDYSGHGNDATVNGATWTSSGLVGGGYVFDGKNDYMRIGDDPSLGGDGTWSEISVEFWIKPTSLQKGGIILAKKDPANSLGSYVVRFSRPGTANTLFFGINNGTTTLDSRGRVVYWRTDIFSDPGTVLPVGEWSHVVCTYE